MTRLAVIAFCLAAMLAASPAHGEQLVLCGGDEVFVLDVSKMENGPPRKVWSWRASESQGLPKELVRAFRTTDDCKPVAGNRMLITSSSGGLVLVDRATKRTLFWARAVNAHSADLLPRNRVVVACSVGEGGNCLAVFDLTEPDKELFHDALYSAHGAVWDEGRQVLWALGNDELRAYRLADWDTKQPRINLAATHRVPETGGHDLVPLPASAELVVTTASAVYRFDRDRAVFSPYAPLANLGSVKSVNVHRDTGRIVFIQADRPDWWTETVRFLSPQHELRLPGLRLYKARWDVSPAR